MASFNCLSNDSPERETRKSRARKSSAIVEIVSVVKLVNTPKNGTDRTPSNEMASQTVLRWHLEQQK